MRNCLKILFFAACCTMLAFSPALAKGDTLNVGVQAAFKTMDPHMTTDAVQHELILQINETLVRLDKDSNVEPLLAERWELLPDKVSYKFYLKKGVTFHNGDAMTADDVVYSFTRALGPTAGAIKVFSSVVASVEKVDDYTVILKAARPMGEPFLLSLGHPWASILSAKATEAAGKDYGQNPMGTGRFKFNNWVVGSSVTLDRFDGYHAEKAKLKTVIFRTIVESSSRTIELESGAVDMIFDAPPTDISRMKDNPRLTVVSVPSCRLYYIGFDVTKAPYDNPKVRQAINLAINREGLAKIVFRGFAEPARGPVTSAIRYNKYDAVPPIKQNIAKAKELLKEAGFPDGFKGSFVIADRSDHTGLSTILQANLKEIGVDMKIETIEWGAFLDVIRQKGHEPFLQNWWGAAPAMDPYFLMAPFHSTAIGGSNRMFFKNKEVDDLLDLGMTLMNGPERQEVYGKVWDILNDQLPWINMVQMQQLYAHDKTLKGIDYAPSFLNYLGNAYFE